MGIGMSSSTADGFLLAIFQQTPFGVAAVWAKPHVGSPGSAGTSNAASETTRVDVSACFGTAPADDGSGAKRVISNDTVFTWTSVAATETWTHVSFWDDDVSGVFIGSATVTGLALTAGDDASVPVGDCTILLGNTT